jgi:hypothetical protein
METHPSDARVIEAVIQAGSQIIACRFGGLGSMELSRSPADLCQIAVPKTSSGDQNQCQDPNRSGYH